MGVRRMGLSLVLFAIGCGGSNTEPVAPVMPPPPAADAAAPTAEAPRPDKPAAPGAITVETFTAPEEAGSVNSFIIANDSELIVVDGQMVVPAAKALVEKIKATTKTPKAFFLTHAHPDHYLGFSVLQGAFPGVPLYATAGVKADFDASAAPTLEAMKKMLGDNAPQKVATVKLLEGSLELGGETLEVTELKGGEHAVSATLRVPSIKSLFVGDNLYAQVHNWMKECDATTWSSRLEDWKKGDAQTVYYPGHGAGKGGAELIEANLGYIKAFEAEVAAAKGKDDGARIEDAKKRVKAKFPAYKSAQLLDWFMADYLKCSKKGTSPARA
jgi:glyoxylase-like metal-dependent hydrolase (beta-lactamase superfamily II)